MSTNRTPEFIERDSLSAHPSEGVSVSLPDGTGFTVERRDFLRLSAVAAAAAGIAGTSGCAPPQEEILPRVHRPEEARVGLPLHYATTCFACPAGCGILVRAREGRVVKVEGNPDHPVNRGPACARGHAMVLDLYDPDRVRRSMVYARGKVPPIDVSPDAIDDKVASALVGKDGRKPSVRVLTGTVSGGAVRSLVADFLAMFPDGRHVAWEPLDAMSETVAAAQELCYGQRIQPQYRFRRANVVVSFGSEFLDTWLSPVQFQRQFGLRRSPDGRREMSRFWAFEGRMSLTGSNADKRIRVRPSQLADVAFAVAHALLVEKKHGPLAADAEIVAALAPWAVEGVASRTGVAADLIRKTAEMLLGAAGKSIVIGGGSNSTAATGLALEIAVNLLNSAVGNDGFTVVHQRPSHQRGAGHSGLAALVDEMRAGKVDVLIVSDVNPVYNAPPVLGFAEAMSHVPFVVNLSQHVDETASLADVICAGAHPLECWLDAAPVHGVVGVGQPAMRPVGEMRGLPDVLIAWAVKAGAKDDSLAGAVTLASVKGAIPTPSYHYIREHWRQTHFTATEEAPEFDVFWRDVLHAGVLIPKVDEAIVRARQFLASALKSPKAEAPKEGQLELVLFAPHGVYDGRGASNGWLLEYPDPVTRVTWDSWVGLSRKKMTALGLTDGDVCEVAVGGWKLYLPAVAVPGQHDDVVSVPLGWGRTAAGAVGSGLGSNGFLLTEMGPLGPQFGGHAVSVRKTGEHIQLAVPQGTKEIDLSVRPLIPYATMSELREDPAAGTDRPEGAWSIWPGHTYPEVRWGMSIDLSRCVGCGACTIACQAENNIPTAGRKGVINGREMHWLRVDRYYRVPVPRTAKTHDEVEAAAAAREKAKQDLSWLDEPEVLFHPLMCQHCENAPCETVCPVGATNHSSDGLNVQAYNRCVGTRYCSNNCPFKARRFNWFDYSKDQSNFLTRLFEPELPRIAQMNSRWPLPLKNNPEVTVRSRGVMEKCTFCVQRIEVGRGHAKDQNRKIRDGDVVTACQQTCPTQAIRFGNLVDEESRVAHDRTSKRALTMLDEQKLGASVTYLTKVRNDES